jgi:hypothetical protein
MGSMEPGALFLERRLRRASAVPVSERGTEVSSFLEAAQLLREVCTQLPLTAGGKPALPLGDLATQRRLWAAMFCAARA